MSYCPHSPIFKKRLPRALKERFYKAVLFNVLCGEICFCSGGSPAPAMPGRFIYRFPDRVRFWKFNALSLRLLAACFLSMWVSSNNRKPILTGFHFSLRPMYALITSWVALTGWKRSEEAVGVAGSVVLSAAGRFPMSRGFRWFGPLWRLAFPVYRAFASLLFALCMGSGLLAACRVPFA